MATFEVEGGAELERALRRLPGQLHKKIMRGAIGQAGREIEQRVERYAPRRRRGSLKNAFSVSTRLLGGLRSATATAKVKAHKDIYWAHMVEFGTRRHIISVKNRPGRMTRRGYREFSTRTINRRVKDGTMVIGRDLVGPMVVHPGARARPFARTALVRGTGAALKRMADYIRKRLAKAI